MFVHCYQHRVCDREGVDAYMDETVDILGENLGLTKADRQHFQKTGWSQLPE